MTMEYMDMERQTATQAAHWHIRILTSESCIQDISIKYNFCSYIW